MANGVPVDPTHVLCRLSLEYGRRQNNIDGYPKVEITSRKQ